MNEHISERRRPAPSHYAPPLITATIGRYLAIYKREHVFDARTTQSVLTHLDSSTFARPLWAKNIKISFIAASLCVSPRCAAGAARHAAPRSPTADRYVTFLFYSLSSGDSPRYVVTSLSACDSGPLIYYLKTRHRLHSADFSDLYAEYARLTMSLLKKPLEPVLAA